MLLGLLLALATPPPTIANTKSSPLCTAVREEIAPAVAGMMFQDRILAHGELLLQNMRMTSGPAVTLNNIHLGIDVYHLAANNISIHQTLDKLAVLSVPDALEAADVKRLHERLLAVADGQAASLNILSGIAQTNDLHDIASVGNEVAAAISADRGNGAPNEGATLGSLKQVDPRTLGGLIAADDRRTALAESALLPALQPIIDRCR